MNKRGYKQEKITENIECEILEVIVEEVYNSYKKEIILELKNEKQPDIEKNISIVIEYINNWKTKKN